MLTKYHRGKKETLYSICKLLENTGLPQIAAFAYAHFSIHKETTDARTISTFETVDVNHYLHFTGSQITAQHHKYSPMDRMQKKKGKLRVA